MKKSVGSVHFLQLGRKGTGFCIISCAILTIFLTPIGSNAQTGPGGVGTTDGSSTLEIWVKADDGLTTSGINVTNWQDRSGNGRAMTAYNTPQRAANKYNGYPAVNFRSGSNSYFLRTTDLPLLFGDNSLTFMAVWETRTPNTSQSIMEQNRFSVYNAQRTCMMAVGSPSFGFNGEFNDAHLLYQPTVADTPYIGVITRNGTAITGGCNGSNSTATLGSSTGTGADGFSFGYKISASNEYFNGYLAEAMVYSEPINAAQIALINNYLSAKYAISLSSGDIYAGDTSGNGDFDRDVAGIARISGTTHTAANSTGLIIQNNGFLTDNGDSILAGHNVASSSIVNTDVPSGVGSRWSRTWFVDIRDAGTANGLVYLTFDFSDAGMGTPPSTSTSYYRLIGRSGTSGAFSTVPTTTTLSGDQVTFSLNTSALTSQYKYTLGMEGGFPTAPTDPNVVSRTQSGIRWGWTDASSDEIGFNIYSGVGATAPVDRTTTAAAGSTWWDQSSLTANTQYAFRVAAYNALGESTRTTNLAAYTMAAAPSLGNNVSCDKSTGTWYPAATSFNFTNPAGFGAGTHGGGVYMVSSYRYVWNTSSTYSFTGSESQWNSGTLTPTVSSSRSYYMHLQSLNGDGIATAETLDIGPFQYDEVGPTGSIAINNGASATNTTVAILNLSASDTGGSGVADMQFANKGGAWSGWEAYSTGKSWTLVSTGDGPTSVSVQYRDAMGNVSTETILDDILIDTAAPQSQATAPTGTSGNAVLTVEWNSSDPGGAAASGIQSVSVYWRKGSGAYALLGTYSFPATQTTFDTQTNGGNGDYSFYTIARDAADNTESAPGTPDISVTVNAPPAKIKDWTTMK